MRKFAIPFLLLTVFFMAGCGKNKDVYASSKNTIFKFQVENGNDAVITGLNDKYKNQGDIIIPYSIDKKVVKRIEDRAFYDAYRLVNIDMSKSKLTEIGKESFGKCVALENIKYPNTIETIKEAAFSDCTNLVKMDLSNLTLTDISKELFRGCSSLTDITLPNASKRLGNNVFLNCDSLTSIDLSNTQIEEFGGHAIYSLKNLNKVVFPSTLKTLRDYSLAENKKLVILDFSQTSLDSIGENTFYSCSMLTKITFPKTISTLGQKAFSHCVKLNKIDLSNTKVTELPAQCFEYCLGMDSITLPLGLTTIGSRAFYNSNINSISIPKTTTLIELDAFRYCSNLKVFNVDMQNEDYTSRNGVLFTKDLATLIAYPALKEDKNFSCPNQTSKINSYAFCDAINLETVDLETASNDLSEIEAYTFANCTSLKSIKIADSADYSIKKIGFKAFMGCTSLESFDACSSITEIGESAFYGCTKLKIVSLASAPLSKIGSEAFLGCNIETLTLSGQLTTIGRSAFTLSAPDSDNPASILFGSTSHMLDELMLRSTGCGLEDYYDLGRIQTS